MTTTLFKNIACLVTMDDRRREITGAAVYVRDGFVEEVGPVGDVTATADTTVDLSGHLVIPGLINTHHHFYQTLTRAYAQQSELFDWLVTLYPTWARMTPEHVSVATRTALAELALSGCTTAFDHQYLWPNGSSIDDQFEGAAPVGIRFHASRGSMSLGQSAGGLPPDEVVESEDAILADCARAIDSWHDPNPGAMNRVVVAPCSPFSVTRHLMKEAVALARERGINSHTHLAETADEESFCLERFGRRPVEYAEELGWVGGDVWFAHAVHVSPTEVELLGSTGTGVAHCPTSNMRLASGAAPIRRYLQAGVPVGLGVDGAASNDGSHLLAEVRQALLLARLAEAGSGEPLMAARSVLELGTRQGARVLGRSDIGYLAPGMAADMAAFRLDRLEFAGAQHDPVAALVLCAPVGVDHLWVQGRQVVEEGHLLGVNLPNLVERHNRLAKELFA